MGQTGRYQRSMLNYRTPGYHVVRFKRRPVLATLILAVLIAALVLPIAFMCSGCSAVQVRGDMAAQMRLDCAKAITIIGATTMPADDYRTYIVDGANTMADYLDAATVNPFVFAFGDKTILVTPSIYNWLQYRIQDAMASASYASELADADVREWAVYVAWQIRLVSYFRDGGAPDTQPDWK